MAKVAAKVQVNQIKKIWVTAKQLGMDEIDLRGLVKNLTGADSISGMTKAQASQLIDYLVDRQKKDYRPEMASAQQLYKVRQLSAEMGWADYQLKGFLRKYAGVENLRWLDARRAYNVIEGLKKIKERIQKNVAK
jgi:hypothetical protein